ncbi:MAG: threonylcarbamoyl-AMP synthase [Planctomycetes bacterium]|nr:threonylcarbamoyl-AMP synthase [Planctomycetota bacterium]
MPTDVVKLDSTISYDETIDRAARLIADGELVAFPTETVYGVGARANSEAAIAVLRKVKNRQENKPFTLHIASPEQVQRYVPDLSPLGRRIIRRAWPGPITIVFEVNSPEDASVVQEQGVGIVDLLYHAGTIGIRCPDHKIAHDLLSRVPDPVVAASANQAGNPPPRSIDGVLSELDGQIALAIDGGPTKYSGPSTVARFDGTRLNILREGVIDSRRLERYATVDILFVCSGNTCRSPMAEGFCRKAIAAHLECEEAELPARKIQVHSAGASAFGGAGASGGAVEAAIEFGISLNGHRARPLDEILIHQADYIYCMSEGHRSAVLAMAPEAAEKTFLLDAKRDITDPFGGSVEEYKRCASDIRTAIAARLKEIEL